MKPFRKLKAPQETTMSAFAPTGWYIAAKPMANTHAAWLATTGEVTSSRDDMAILFYGTELEAYGAASTYYARHSMYYPHSPALVDMLHYGTSTDGSQVMEFI